MADPEMIPTGQPRRLQVTSRRRVPHAQENSRPKLNIPLFSLTKPLLTEVAVDIEFHLQLASPGVHVLRTRRHATKSGGAP